MPVRVGVKQYYARRREEVLGGAESSGRRLLPSPMRSVSVWCHVRVHGGRDRTTAAGRGLDGPSRRGRRERAVHGRDADRQRRAECAVCRARGPGGGWRNRGQRSRDCGISQGTKAPPAHQLLHRIVSRRRPACGSGGHTVCRAGQRRSAPSTTHLRLLRVTAHRAVHRLHTQPRGRIRRPILGHTLPDGLLHQIQHQNRAQ